MTLCVIMVIICKIDAFFCFSYLLTLLEYMEGFLLRIKPLHDVQKEMELVVEDFSQDWEGGVFPGWPVSNFCLSFNT